MNTVDLSAQERPAVELTLSGQTWVIRRVVMATFELYHRLLAGAHEAQVKLAELQNQLAAKEANEVDLTRAQDELAAETVARQNTTYDAIRSILEANGYEFDREWWQANSDRHEQHAFIAAALNKDLAGMPPATGKKKADG